MLTILHISDLHCGPLHDPRAAETLLRLAPDLSSDVIVASGDFTQRAKEHQFREARAFLDRLPAVPLVVTPGNHDVPLYRVFERFFWPYHWYRRYISQELDSVLRVDGAVIVSLNSTAPRRAITNGRIHRRQLDFAAEAFHGVPKDACRIIVAHHHFAPAPDYEGGEVMPKSKRAMDRFVQLGVEVILGGHLHRAYIGNSLDVYPGIARDRGIIICQSGTTTSRRGRAREKEKNTFNLLHICNKRIRVTHYMYIDEVKDFRPVSRHLFPRPGERFLADDETAPAEEPLAERI